MRRTRSTTAAMGSGGLALGGTARSLCGERPHRGEPLEGGALRGRQLAAQALDLGAPGLALALALGLPPLCFERLGEEEAEAVLAGVTAFADDPERSAR